MKSIVCLVMSFHLLLLSVWPCADGCMQLHVDKQTTTSIATDNHQHDGNRTDADLCSPFCGCACCGMVMASAPTFQFSFAAFSFSSRQLNLSVPALASALLSCWQPPQIG